MSSFDDEGSVFDNANVLFDQRAYVDVIRSIADFSMKQSPSQRLLWLLDQSEREESLRLREEIFTNHPSSFDCCVNHVQALIRAKYAGQAVVATSRLLSELPAGDFVAEMALRSLRATAAREAADFATFADELLNLWKLGEVYERAKSLRYGLLKQIAMVAKPSALPALHDKVSQTDTLPLTATAFVRAKIEELQRLQGLQEELRYREEQARN